MKNLFLRLISSLMALSTFTLYSADKIQYPASAFDQSKLKLENIRNKEVKKLMDYIEKKSMEPITIQPKSDFLKDN